MLRIGGSTTQRLISSFLIAFGIVGYVACVPLTVVSHSALSLLPSSLSDIQTTLEDVEGMVSEAERVLLDLSTGLDEMLLAVSLFDFSSGVDAFNSSLASVQAMLNETVHIVDSVEQTLNENADWLSSLANNSGIQLVAPDVAAGAGALATSMRSTIDTLNWLLLDPAIASLTELQPYVTVLLTHFESVSTEIQRQLQTYQTSVASVTTRIGNITMSIEQWIANVQNIRNRIWIINVALYGLVGYIVLMHTAFLLTGVALRALSK